MPNPIRASPFMKINKQKSEPEFGQNTPQEFSLQTATRLTSQSTPEIKHQVSYTFDKM